MALVVEDGTGLATAESYVTVAQIETYAGLRGLAFTGSTIEKERAARESARSLDLLYERIFHESRLTETQRLAYPRTLYHDRHDRVIAAGTVPQDVKDAQCELAIRSRAGDNLVPDTTNKMVLGETHSTEEYSHSQRYATAVRTAEGAPVKRYEMVDRLLRPHLRGHRAVLS